MACRSCLECTWKSTRSQPCALASALLAGIAAIVNAAWTRVVRVTVKLPNLPAAWRGRTAALVSDLHLGHVRNAGFLRRIVRKLSQLRPDVLFIPGDLYDGTAVDLARLAKPWSEFSAPLGAYFVTGNHEQFSSPTKYLDAVRQSGIRVLENEKIVLDGLQIVGVHYHDSTNVEQIPIDPAAGGSGPEGGQHPARSQSEPLACRGRGGHFLATVRSYAPRTVFSVHGHRFPHLWKICLRIESLRRSCGLHFLRRRHLGPAHAAGIKPRNCPLPIRMKLRGARDSANDIQVNQSGFSRRILSKMTCCLTPAHKPSTFARNIVKFEDTDR